MAFDQKFEKLDQEKQYEIEEKHLAMGFITGPQKKRVIYSRRLHA
jgi:hypothetical protein